MALIRYSEEAYRVPLDYVIEETKPNGVVLIVWPKNVKGYQGYVSPALLCPAPWRQESIAICREECTLRFRHPKWSEGHTKVMMRFETPPEKHESAWEKLLGGVETTECETQTSMP